MLCLGSVALIPRKGDFNLQMAKFKWFEICHLRVESLARPRLTGHSHSTGCRQLSSPAFAAISKGKSKMNNHLNLALCHLPFELVLLSLRERSHD